MFGMFGLNLARSLSRCGLQYDEAIHAAGMETTPDSKFYSFTQCNITCPQNPWFRLVLYGQFIKKVKINIIVTETYLTTFFLFLFSTYSMYKNCIELLI